MADELKARVLNVNDSDATREAVNLFLRQAGFEVIEAATGNEALQMAKENPDLIVLDVNLPDVNGFEVCRRIRADPSTSSIPVLHLSATYVDDRSKAKGLEGGADAYLTHPVEPPVLVATVKALLRMRHAEAVVQTAEQQWQATFDAIGAGVSLLDMEGNILQSNRASGKLLGKPLADIIGRTYCEAMYGSEEPVEGCPVVRMRQSHQRETTVLPMNGRWIEVNADPLTDDSGELVGAVYVMSDITERRRAEVALRRQNEELNEARQAVEAERRRYQALFEFAPDGYLVTDTSGIIKEANLAAATLLGTPQNLLTGKPLTAHLHEKDRRTLHSLLMSFRGGMDTRSLGLEVALHSPDGSPLPAVLTVATARDEHGELVALRWLLRDTAEQKRAEEALRESEERYRSLVETSPDGIALTDLDGNIIFCNQQNAGLLGLEDTAQAEGRNTFDFIAPEDRQDARDNWKKALEAGSIRNAEHTFLRRDSSVFSGEMNASLVSVAEGKPNSFIVMLRDITERKKLEQQVRQATKMDAIGRLAGGVAHDFNNQLTAILGYTELILRKTTPDDPLRKTAEEIRKAGERSAALTHQLLAFSRRQILEPAVLDLNVVIADMHLMLQRLIGEDIKLVTIPEDDLGQMKADLSQMEQIIMNLVVNAREAMPDGGQLTIETTNSTLDARYCEQHPGARPGQYVTLVISDTGVGMSEEVQSHLFEPFFTTKDQGTGLGLATVYGIIKQHDGSIWCYSEEGKGTTFKVHLPRVDEPDTLVEQEETGESPRGDETILVVEDEDQVRDITVQILESQGYNMLEASSGEAALALCAEYQEKIHLLITDVVMPGMSGRDLADRLTLTRPEMRVIYMSGYTDNAIVQHGILQEGIDFINKPFMAGALALKVRRVLDR
jgi:PAS domain S-box-containing protein